MRDMDPVFAIELTFTGLLLLALGAISWISIGVLVNLFKGQS